MSKLHPSVIFSKLYHQLNLRSFSAPKKLEDRVAFASDAVYSIGESNPRIGSDYECFGTVKIVTSSGVRVMWDNDHMNSYNHFDLLHVFEGNNPNLMFKQYKKRNR